MDENGCRGTTRIHDATQHPAGQGYAAVNQHYPANISEASRYEFEHLMTSMGFRANYALEIRTGRRTPS